MKLVVLIALGVALAAAQYDSGVAMSALYYSKSAYCDASDVQGWTCDACSYNGQLANVSVYQNTDCGSQGYVGYNTGTNQIIVAFRGTANIANWIKDLDFIKTTYAACSGCEVHQGFYEVYQSMQQGILSSVQSLLQSNPGTAVFVTGHSLGAAVSLLAALDIQTQYQPSSLTLYNFGDPRVGNDAFAAWAASTLPDGKQYRVTHSADPVPHVPPMDFGFLHCPHEEWYDNDGDSSWSDCQDSATAEDPNCSDSVDFPIDIDDHLLYLGVCTECSCSGTLMSTCSDVSLAAGRCH